MSDTKSKVSTSYILSSEIFDQNYKNNIKERSRLKWRSYGSIRLDNIIYNIYSPELNRLFDFKKLQMVNAETNQLEEVYIYPYFQEYIKGVKAGIDEFNLKYRPSKDNIQGTNGQIIIQELHNHYYSDWYYQCYVRPSNISIESIFNHGYYSGLVTSVHQLIDIYPILFKTYFKSETENSSLVNSKIVSKSHFRELFKSNTAYEEILQLLVSNNYCYPSTFRWNYSKGYLLKLLWELQSKNYFQRNLTEKDVNAIFKNPFQMGTISHKTFCNKNNRPFTSEGKSFFEFISSYSDIGE